MEQSILNALVADCLLTIFFQQTELWTKNICLSFRCYFFSAFCFCFLLHSFTSRSIYQRREFFMRSHKSWRRNHCCKHRNGNRIMFATCNSHVYSKCTKTVKYSKAEKCIPKWVRSDSMKFFRFLGSRRFIRSEDEWLGEWKMCFSFTCESIERNLSKQIGFWIL